MGNEVRLVLDGAKESLIKSAEDSGGNSSKSRCPHGLARDPALITIS